MSAKIKIKDIAEKTGLSTTTVSRVLTGKAKQYRIGKKSQKIIQEVAKELNYIPNHFAANLRSGKSNTISLIVPSLGNPFFANIASLLNREVRKLGYTLIISDTNEDTKAEMLEIQQLISRNVEGFIIIPCGENFEHIEKLYSQGLPLILLDRYFENSNLPFVSTDNYYGAITATKYLIEHGHTSIACIQGVKSSTPNKMRIKGFKQAMQEVGNTNIHVIGDDFSVQNGYQETKLLLRWKERPTAIFALSNTITMGCLKALKEENIKVPDDISVITFDDHPYLDFLETPITSIAQPVEHVCKIGLKYLLSKLNNELELITDHVTLRPDLKIRNSVKKI
ncbi:LacI family DNA-binding transcriptional regulator [Marinifilum caeruleilacunae]|uniref:LacI family transcriptional regulator n=1 Tax=Marinifilum caeruleilacunae TaxID=2499076 RepID=A0ABX1X124_9BACT|nr:LacI family DNA-binding transcriptional regulator [Marinifilum caeruleilacunae]NOU61775.1 LacI family transcriptional regulator [Marinifilum caeruleilacunae]